MLFHTILLRDGKCPFHHNMLVKLCLIVVCNLFLAACCFFGAKLDILVQNSQETFLVYFLYLLEPTKKQFWSKMFSRNFFGLFLYLRLCVLIYFCTYAYCFLSIYLNNFWTAGAGHTKHAVYLSQNTKTMSRISNQSDIKTISEAGASNLAALWQPLFKDKDELLHLE